MKKRSLIFIGLIIITLTSCKFLVRKYLGIKQPRIESTQSITAYMTKYGIVSKDSYYLDSIASYTYWKDSKRERITNLEIFNGKGELLKKLGAQECSGTFAKTLETIDLPSMKPVIINTEKLEDVLTAFRRVDNSKTQLTDFKSDEYIVTIFWMKCFGWDSFKGDVQEWTMQLQRNPSSSKIKILYLNTDMHESWGIKSKDDDRRIVFDF